MILSIAQWLWCICNTVQYSELTTPKIYDWLSRTLTLAKQGDPRISPTSQPPVWSYIIGAVGKRHLSNKLWHYVPLIRDTGMLLV